MEHYLLNWGHAYILHFGLWVTMLTLFSVHKDGLPEQWSSMRNMLRSVVVLSTVMSVFSSHSQTHLIEHFLSK